MTGALGRTTLTNRRFNLTHIGAALVLGALLGVTTTLLLDGGLLLDEPLAPAAVAPPDGPTSQAVRDAAATAQYEGWYLRTPTGAASWLAETKQYTDEWYARAADLAGSTTASEQYYSYYLGRDGK